MLGRIFAATWTRLFCGFVGCGLVGIIAGGGHAEEAVAESKRIAVAIADGKFTLMAPSEWEKKQPTTNIVEYEFAIPRAEGDTADGRLTIMAAGGSVEQNIDRWAGQFKAPAGGKVAKKTEKKMLAGQTVHFVDLKGSYLDRRGPFAPATERASYRMLGAIIVTEGQGQHFIKLYGPEKTIAQSEKTFQEFVDSLSTRD